jgi:hypothetical protein
MVHQIGQSKCRRNSPVEQASFDSAPNLEPSFKTLVNCIGARSLACEKNSIFLYPTAGVWTGRKTQSRFPEEFYATFYSGGKPSINNGGRKTAVYGHILFGIWTVLANI